MTKSYPDIDIEAFYKKPYTMCFDVAIMAYGFYFAVRYSQLDFLFPFHFLKQISLLVSIFYSLLSIIHNYKWNLFRTALFVFMIITPFGGGISLGIKRIGIPMLILAAYNIPFSHIVKQCIKVVIMIFILVLTCLALGIVQDELYYREKVGHGSGYAHSLGFRYYGYYAYIGMGLVQCMIYKWMKKMNMLKIFWLLLLSYLLFLVSFTRLQLYCSILFLCSIFVLPLIPQRFFNNKASFVLSIILYPILCFLVYYIAKNELLSMYLDNVPELNRLTAGRIYLNAEALRRYDVNLWGNNIENSTDPGASDYFYIDSGYLHTLLGSGLVYTCVIMFLYSFLFYKVYKAKAYFLYLWLSIYSILCVFNGLLMNVLANPIILLFLTETKVIEKDYMLFSRIKKE